jgi:hypothetical protein
VVSKTQRAILWIVIAVSGGTVHLFLLGGFSACCGGVNAECVLGICAELVVGTKAAVKSLETTGHFAPVAA